MGPVYFSHAEGSTKGGYTQAPVRAPMLLLEGQSEEFHAVQIAGMPAQSEGHLGILVATTCLAGGLCLSRSSISFHSQDRVDGQLGTRVGSRPWRCVVGMACEGSRVA